MKHYLKHASIKCGYNRQLSDNSQLSVFNKEIARLQIFAGFVFFIEVIAIILFLCSCKSTELISRSDDRFIHARDSVIENASVGYEQGDIFTVYYSDTDYVIKKTETENMIIDVRYYDNPIEIGIVHLLLAAMLIMLTIEIILN